MTISQERPHRFGLGVAHEMDYLSRSGVAVSVDTTVIDAPASAGSHLVVPLAAAKRTVVLNYTILTPGTVQARWQSGSAAALTNITGGMHVARGLTPPFTPAGHFRTAASAGLYLNIGAAVSAAGHCTFARY